MKPETWYLKSEIIHKKSTVMKKAFLFRLLALTFFCMASLVIKSETSSCKLQCTYAAQKAPVMQSLLNDRHDSLLYHDDGFFIRI